MTHHAANKTDKMLLKTEQEIYDVVVASDHPFRRLDEILNFTELTAP
jgi:hypothetical protein